MKKRICGIFIILPGEDREASVVDVDQQLVVQTAGVVLPDYDLPGRPEGFVIRYLDVGGDLGEAPGGVLQGGRHDVTSLSPLLRGQGTSDDHRVVVDIFVAAIRNGSLRESDPGSASLTCNL